MTLTKADIVDCIRNELGFPRKRSADIMEAFLEILKRSMAEGEEILVSGFGKFCVNEKRARRGRNPSTGNDLMLGKRRVVTFKCSQVLRKRMNEE
jgi:integration host factor subunit alpha